MGILRKAVLLAALTAYAAGSVAAQMRPPSTEPTEEPGRPTHGPEEPGRPTHGTEEPGRPTHSTEEPGRPTHGTEEPGRPPHGTDPPAGGSDALAQYWSDVYPISSCETPVEDRLEFFYAWVPDEVANLYGGRPATPAEGSELCLTPPAMNATWHPIWYWEGTFQVNVYDPEIFWENKYAAGLEDNTTIEVMHVYDGDNPWYVVYGTWYYVTPGSGVFLDIGRSLRAMNKIDALAQLGYTYEQLAEMFISIGDVMVNCHESMAAIPITTIAEGAFGDGSITGVTELMRYLVEGPSLIDSSNPEEVAMLSDIHRAANSAAYDEYVVNAAREQGYSSVQMTTQANGNGGWAFEIVFVEGQSATSSDWEVMLPRLSVQDPCGEGYEQCDFDPNAFNCIYCGQSETAAAACRA